MGAKKPRRVPLKRSAAFYDLYHRGRWARGRLVSVAVLAADETQTSVGIRFRRGIVKDAVSRNRIKRQVRGLVFTRRLPLRLGLMVLIVLHPRTIPIKTDDLECELIKLCAKAENLLYKQSA